MPSTEHTEWTGTEDYNWVGETGSGQEKGVEGKTSMGLSQASVCHLEFGFGKESYIPNFPSSKVPGRRAFHSLYILASCVCCSIVCFSSVCCCIVGAAALSW